MGHRAHTTLLAWPYPGREQLPQRVLDDLDRNDALPEDDTPIDEQYLVDRGAVVLAGDERSGPILAIVDEQADDRTAAYAGLIAALTGARMHVFAGNDAGRDYSAGWSTTRRPATAVAPSGAAVIAAFWSFQPAICSRTASAPSPRSLTTPSLREHAGWSPTRPDSRLRFSPPRTERRPRRRGPRRPRGARSHFVSLLSSPRTRGTPPGVIPGPLHRTPAEKEP
jgi:hypothetical protein